MFILFKELATCIESCEIACNNILTTGRLLQLLDQVTDKHNQNQVIGCITNIMLFVVFFPWTESSIANLLTSAFLLVWHVLYMNILGICLMVMCHITWCCAGMYC